ncbi:MAG: hypothetical protein IIB16_02395 [Chloroflexi bacterium]|nr:hypothetical protein [Chloroflexota bacterium]MCH9038356.1 hypothetical protein [Chloroflexota bacterium]
MQSRSFFCLRPKLAGLTPEELQASSDHEFPYWVTALGVVGDRPANIIDAPDVQSQVWFKVLSDR